MSKAIYNHIRIHFINYLLHITHYRKPRHITLKLHRPTYGLFALIDRMTHFFLSPGLPADQRG